ncbi:early-responsive to dehydration stress-related protein [Klebsormidium nitens]|uniref:Early-responsive to dehydration stress-related protein n=1 Tax=Klebsormidium nitens TaxID=105231 RepID=A0A1Y1IJI5_KLENI|nr:early-responsive to dehydration stress-related protein [Klebsormidium nitens]|eukprot:GAQ91055.1 early-responsive to dehydration stress-related protein [Klebsormidium nitens]
MAGISDLLTSMGINMGLVTLFLTLYSMFSKQPFNARVYFTRQYIKTKDFGRTESGRLVINPLEYLTMAAWLKKAIVLPEDDLLGIAGLDAVVLMRLFILSIKLFGFCSVIGLFVLMPINATDKFLTLHKGKINYEGIDKLSLANVSLGSKRLWAHLIAVYLISGYAFWLLWKEYKEISEMRHSYLADAKRAPDQFTVLTRQVPPSATETISEHVEHFFTVQHPHTYLTHRVVVDANHLEDLKKQRDKALNKLEGAEIVHARNPEKRPRQKLGFLGLYGHEVDALDHFTRERDRLNALIEKEKEALLHKKHALMPTAFVSFKSRWGAAVAAQTQQTRNPQTWKTEWAPEPRDVFWPNLAIPPHHLFVRELAVTAAVFWLCFFYMIPVVFVQTLAELKNLEKTGSWVRAIATCPGIGQFLQGFLPGLALKLFLMLLPGILMILSKIEGHISNSNLARVAAGKLFMFLVINGFFGSVLTGSLFKQLNLFFSQPKNIPKALGAAIPAKSTFFITYIMVDGWAGSSAEILQLIPLILYHLRMALLVRTAEDRFQALNLRPVIYETVVPSLLFYILIGLVYSCVSPLLLPFIFIHFGLGYVVYRNQIINVYERAYESNGRFWPYIHSRIVTCLYVMQITLIGVFILKDAKQQTPFLFPLPVLTFLFNRWCKDAFFPSFARYSIESAMTKDTLDWARADSVDPISFVKDAYLHPAFKDKKRLPRPGLASPRSGGESSGEEDGEEPRVVPLKGKYRQSNRSGRESVQSGRESLNGRESQNGDRSGRESLTGDPFLEPGQGRSSQDGSCRSPSDLGRNGTERSGAESGRKETWRESKAGSARASKRSSAIAPLPPEEEVEVHEFTTD